MKKVSLLICAISLIALGAWQYSKQKITISIIVPVYNAASYLTRCLDSIMMQSGSFEVVVINDGSTDDSLKIIKEYAKKHSNIRIVNQTNKGVSAARNAGIEAAQNKYITFVDADDWLEPDAFAKAIRMLKKDKPDILLTGYYDVYDREWVRDVKGEEYVNEVPKENKYLNRDLDRLALFSPFYGKEAHSDLYYASGGVRLRFFKNDFIKKHNIDFPLGINCNEDAVFTFRAYLNNPLISVLPEPLHNYRNRADSISKSRDIIKNASVSLAAMHNTPEFKQSNRRTQMIINDRWLFLITLGFANMQRHNVPVVEGIDDAYNALQKMQGYNQEELKSCRNYQKLKSFLQKRGVSLLL